MASGNPAEWRPGSGRRQARAPESPAPIPEARSSDRCPRVKPAAMTMRPARHPAARTAEPHGALGPGIAESGGRRVELHHHLPRPVHLALRRDAEDGGTGKGIFCRFSCRFGRGFSRHTGRTSRDSCSGVSHIRDAGCRSLRDAGQGRHRLAGRGIQQRRHQPRQQPGMATLRGSRPSILPGKAMGRQEEGRLELHGIDHAKEGPSMLRNVRLPGKPGWWN